MIDTIQIRPLTMNDLDLYKQMQTGIENDYIIRIFDRLINHKEHQVFGLFVENELVSIAGYTVFAGHYAMLGRLRSDLRYTGKGYATQLIQFIIEQLKKMPEIKWIGANTQRHNFSALRVLEKVQLPPIKALHASTLVNSDGLDHTPGPIWTPLESLEEKRKWISQFENDSNVIFPYQAYYPFPATPELFNDDEVSNWLFYKNPDEDRLIIVYHDQKKYNYAHVVYLWDDLFNQPGAWETIYEAHKTLQQQHDEELKIRTDLTDESRKLINDDAFEIQDPWVLHGVWV